jgi:hypothetical protein
MGKRRRHVVMLGALTGAFGIAVLLGAAERGAADVADPQCADRPFCVALEDQDHQSRSLDAPHYMKYILTISRDADGGRSNLTNGRATLTLADVIGEDDATTTNSNDPADVPANVVFQEDPSDPRCKAGTGQSKHIVTCAVPNFPAGAADLVYAPLIFTTTARTESASPFTKSVAEVTFKEKGSDGPPSDPNQDSVVLTNYTDYEPLDDLDSSWAFRKATITLGTSATADEQHTTFGFTVPDTTTAPSFTAFVGETPVSEVAAGDNPCGTNTCYGEIATTHTNNNSGVLFSATKPVNVVVTWDFLPSGKTKNNIVGYHKLDSGATEPPITASCTKVSGVPTNLPCRDVEIKRFGGGQVQVTISMYSAGNGGWGVG